MALFPNWLSGNSRGRPARTKRSTPRRSRRPNRKSQNSNNAKLAAAIVVPLVGLGAAGYGAVALMDGEVRDEHYCYTRPDQHQAVIFMDNSLEGESEAQLRDYRTGMLREWDRLPANALIRIASTAKGDDSSFAEPAFTICKPAQTPAEQEELGAPDETAPMLARIHEEALTDFEAAVEHVIADATDQARQASDSPIFEQYQAISRYDGFTGPNRSLLSISDGISNSEAGRFCRDRDGLVPFEQFKTLRRYRDVEPSSFDGLDVTLLMVEFGELPAPGAPHCSNEELRDFWPEYFTANGAESVDLRRLRYWQQD